MVMFSLNKQARDQFDELFLLGAIGWTCKITAAAENFYAFSLSIVMQGSEPIVLNDVQLTLGDTNDAMNLQDQDVILFASPRLLPEHDDIYEDSNVS